MTTKKIFILITTIMYLNISYSKVTSTVSTKIFSKYLSCVQYYSEDKINEFNSCVNKYIDKNLTNSSKFKLKEFLSFKLNTSKAFECSKITKERMSAMDINGGYLCFNIFKDDMTSEGIVFFKTIENSVYVTKIKYQIPTE